MSQPRILVVDDEPAVRRFLRTSLGPQGYELFEAENGLAAIEGIRHHRPDVVLLDLGLPDLEGTEVTRLVREWSQLPIIILSVRDQEAQKVAALDAGADDFLTKPFGLSELLARIRVALRRSARTQDEPVFTTGDLNVDLAARTVRRGDLEIQLTPTEYDLLRVLVRHAGKVLTHRQLIREVWGAEYDLHTLRVNISNLRRKIEPDAVRPRYLVTEPGVGYRLRLS